jgi:hypothetical protein
MPHSANDILFGTHTTIVKVKITWVHTPTLSLDFMAQCLTCSAHGLYLPRP